MNDEPALLEEWLERVLTSSAVYEELNRQKYADHDPDTPPDDSFGWGAVIMQHILEPGRNREIDGYFITGRHGTGRHHAAGFAVCAFLSNYFDLRYIDCSDLPFENTRQLTEALGSVLQPFSYDDDSEDNDGTDEPSDASGQKYCLVIDEPEHFARPGELYRVLGNLLYYSLADDDNACIRLVIISGEEPRMPAALRERLLVCRTKLPDEQMRRKFIGNRAHYAESAGYLETLTELTEGVDFAELRDICRNLHRYYRDNRVPPDETVIEQLTGLSRSVPQEEPSDSEYEYEEQSDGLPVTDQPLSDKILERVDKVIDLLPTLLSIVYSRSGETYSDEDDPEIENADIGEIVKSGDVFMEKYTPVPVPEVTEMPEELTAEQLENIPTAQIMLKALNEEQLNKMREQGVNI